ncbi:MAG: HEPN domain-containing protein [Bacteroidetes bacterium]|nr:HEPN domain-containing protein [Bacteroidota bacterium]
MNKQDYLNYWLKTSEEDWSSSADLFKTNHYLQSLFFAHLSLEKLCKALWVKSNTENHPPRIHNVVSLIKQTTLEISDEQLDFFLMFNDFQLEGRYPDYKNKIYQFCDKPTTQNLLTKANEYRIWLLSKLQ